jgi:hypothetical protein
MHSSKVKQRRKADATGAFGGGGTAAPEIHTPAASGKRPTPPTKKQKKGQNKGMHWTDAETSKMLDCIEELRPTGNYVLSICRCNFDSFYTSLQGSTNGWQ